MDFTMTLPNRHISCFGCIFYSGDISFSFLMQVSGLKIFTSNPVSSAWYIPVHAHSLWECSYASVSQAITSSRKP